MTLLQLMRDDQRVLVQMQQQDRMTTAEELGY
jgi:hypothetical protein